MSRRCLQGMIRDFCKIKKPVLKLEIDHLKEPVDEGNAPQRVSMIDAIDTVRAMGNIGAHMAEDINLVIDIEPNEAQALIELIEILFEEWYVAGLERESKLKKQGFTAGKRKEVPDREELPAPNNQPVASNSERDRPAFAVEWSRASVVTAVRAAGPSYT